MTNSSFMTDKIWIASVKNFIYVAQIRVILFIRLYSMVI